MSQTYEVTRQAMIVIDGKFCSLEPRCEELLYSTNIGSNACGFFDDDNLLSEGGEQPRRHCRCQACLAATKGLKAKGLEAPEGVV